MNYSDLPYIEIPGGLLAYPKKECEHSWVNTETRTHNSESYFKDAPDYIKQVCRYCKGEQWIEL